ncbi:hypothetical protein C1645_752949 [Glomus cerebriforme]|uniref:Zn(2)-C6 fungal-type domain-containing protein n=1 Tax=Glomus cerebriforme TaxID=658196 RepID=A0A397TIE0_9GLOM|nr:hypothetical protein C1645_752949 [Glomus cerebriforme]
MPKVKTRKNITVACNRCRIKKQKCSGGPICSRCLEKKVKCHFSDRKKRGPPSKKSYSCSMPNHESNTTSYQNNELEEFWTRNNNFIIPQPSPLQPCPPPQPFPPSPPLPQPFPQPPQYQPPPPLLQFPPQPQYPLLPQLFPPPPQYQPFPPQLHNAIE